jgi:RND superfamily putative drug exporter
VLLDSFVVRSILVTALNLDVGRAMWWPSRLYRRPGDAPQDPEPGQPPVDHQAVVSGGNTT